MNAVAFYEACLVQTRTRHFHDPRTRQATMSPSASEHKNQRFHRELINVIRNESKQRHLDGSEYASHMFIATEVSDEDLGLICGVVWAYRKVCAYRNKNIIPVETILCGKELLL